MYFAPSTSRYASYGDDDDTGAFPLGSPSARHGDTSARPGRSMFSVPEHQLPQTAEAMKKNTVRDFRIERIRKRQMDMAERREVPGAARWLQSFEYRRLDA